MSTPVVEKTRVTERARQRTITYVGLTVVFVSAAFPLWWSFIIGSGDASSLRERPWWPGGNFIDNALAVVSNPAVNFWPALWNSIY
jgi:cellobiose transport system permease protein